MRLAPEVLPLVVGMQRARHVLRVFDILLLWAFHGEEQIAGAGTPDRSRRKAARHVFAIERLEIRTLEADVHKADGLRRLLLWIHLNKLLVIHLEERFGYHSILGKGKRLFKTQLLVEVTGSV